MLKSIDCVYLNIKYDKKQLNLFIQASNVKTCRYSTSENNVRFSFASI